MEAQVGVGLATPLMDVVVGAAWLPATSAPPPAESHSFLNNLFRTVFYKTVLLGESGSSRKYKMKGGKSDWRVDGNYGS
jgi:hypothetical protein